MAQSAQEIKKHVRGYMIVGGILYVFTLITVAISYLHLSVVPAIILAMCVAIIKATLVALYFMHLIDEKKLIYVSLGITAAFFVFLMCLPVSQLLDVFKGITY